jgi:hypothetical protein
MENFEKQDPLEVLRSQIEQIKEEEMKKKEEKKYADPHYDHINPAELTEADLKIFEKFRKDELTLEEFDEYRKGFNSESTESSKYFSAWVANKLSAKIMEEELKKFKK